MNGVINLYTQGEEAQGDMLLQMRCMEYLKNFYNDYNFKVVKYAHLLGQVLPICNKMVLKYSDASNQQ